MSQKILVIGASRGIGLETVKSALDSGYMVRALARSASYINIEDDNLEKFSGDALNGDNVENALEGIDVVIQTLGIPINLRMLTGPIDLFSNSTRILVNKMEATGIKRLISVTGFGSGRDGRQLIPPLQRIGFEIFLGRVYSDKNIQEDIIKASHLDWTIVRPGILTSGRLSDNYRVLVEPETWRNGLISREDVANFLVKQISDSMYINETPVLIGAYKLPHI
ncbi:MAG: hypothetical protein TECD_00796 [Hyphomicrobiaceae bacterium hypho_1]